MSEEIKERLNKTVEWIDSQLSYLATNDKDRYISFEWLKSHLLSIRDNENRDEISETLTNP